MIDGASIDAGSTPRKAGVPALTLVCAACAIVPGIAVVAIALWKMTFAILGRDQGIFQYVGWALSKGERDYVDFREINGPLIHFIHLLFLKLGGADEHRFRLLDVLLSSVVFFGVGAALPGISRRPSDTNAPPTWLERAIWGLAGWVVLGSQYAGHGWWQSAQRESLYNLFLMGSIVLQLLATRPGVAPSRARTVLIASGVLSALTWFGKPTCVIYTGMQAIVLYFNEGDRAERRARVLYLSLGAVAASIVMVAALAMVGSPMRAAHIILTEVPRLYRYIWKRSWIEAYQQWNNGPKLNYAFATLLVTLPLLRLSRVTVRFLAIPTLLVGGLVTFFAQGKGFPYHMHPITAGTNFLWLAFLVHLSERLQTAPAGRIPRGALVGGGLLVGFLSFDRAYYSEYRESDWNVSGATVQARAQKDFVQQFPWGDFFAWDLREGAQFVREHTSPDERIQTYGMDPYFLFLAQRLSATPYIYSFELNVDASIEGGSGGKPDASERQWLATTATAHADEWLAALKARPPSAFVLIDHAPFVNAQNADVDLEEHCPAVSKWVEENFAPAAQFGVVRIWLPRQPRTAMP